MLAATNCQNDKLSTVLLVLYDIKYNNISTIDFWLIQNKRIYDKLQFLEKFEQIEQFSIPASTNQWTVVLVMV